MAHEPQGSLRALHPSQRSHFINFVDKSRLSEKHYAEIREIANRTFSCHYFKNDDFGEVEIYIFEKK